MSKTIKNKINDALFSFYLEADKETINDSLKSEIHNQEEFNKKKKQIIFLAQAKAKKQHNDYLLELANKFHEAILKNSEKPIAIFNQMIQNKTQFAYYRNLEKITKEDIIEVIKDKNLIDLLEQLEENEKGN